MQQLESADLRWIHKASRGELQIHFKRCILHLKEKFRTAEFNKLKKRDFDRRFYLLLPEDSREGKDSSRELFPSQKLKKQSAELPALDQHRLRPEPLQK